MKKWNLRLTALTLDISALLCIGLYIVSDNDMVDWLCIGVFALAIIVEIVYKTTRKREKR